MSESTVRVRYWAGAKAAAGVGEETVPAPLSLSALVAEVVARHRDNPRFADVVGVCSVLVDERPVGAADPDRLTVHPGAVVDLLPPFAGG